MRWHQGCRSAKGSLVALVFATVMVLGGASATLAADGRPYDEIKRNLTQSSILQDSFPRLPGSFEVIGEATPRYNCIAYSLGITDRWVNPETGPSHAPLSLMDRMYVERGYYRQHDMNWRVEPGVEKRVHEAALEGTGMVGGGGDL